jgi:hypothetical protein
MLLMEPDESANLAWELQHLRRTGLHTRLAVVTRPAIALLSPWRVLHWWVRFMRWARGVRATTWPRFVERVAGHGYMLDPSLPPDGRLAARAPPQRPQCRPCRGGGRRARSAAAVEDDAFATPAAPCPSTTATMPCSMSSR